MRRRRFAFAGALTFTPFVMLACNGVLGIDPPNVVDPDGSTNPDGEPLESAAMEGATDTTAPPTDAGADVPNLLLNGDFEKAGCANWFFDVETVTSSPVARSGMRSCMVCGNNSSSYGIQQRIAVSKLTEGVTYDVQAFVQLPPTGVDASTNMVLGVHLDDGPFRTAVAGTEAPGPDLDMSWQKMTNSLTYTATDGGSMLSVNVLNRFMDHACFLVDDVTVVPHTP